MDPLALIEDYLSDQENGMKNLITWFLNQVMLAEALRQAGAAQYERTDARKAHRKRLQGPNPQDPIRGDSPPETPVPRVPVRDAGLRALFPG